MAGEDNKILPSEKKLYSEIQNNGYLAVPPEDAVGKAIKLSPHLEESRLGSGAESLAVRAQLVYGKLGLEGWRQLCIPILTHQYLKENSNTVSHWEEHHSKAVEETSKMKKTQLEMMATDFYAQNGIIGDDKEIALRLSKYESGKLLRESRLRKIVGMQHPNIAYHLAVGSTLEDETSHVESRPYSIMELINAGELNSVQTKEYPTKELIDIFEQVINGLKRLHEFGLVHRDLKPANLFLKVLYDSKNPYKHENQVKIADYGLMRPEIYGESTNNTVAGSILGTPNFMSPEQAMGETETLDWRSDQFSAGATFYTCITNENAMGLSAGNHTPLRVISAAKDRTYPLNSIVTAPNIQREGLEMVLGRMMQKRKEDRYQNYDELLNDLKLVKQGKHPRHTDPSYLNRVFRPSQLSGAAYRKRRRNKIIAAGASAAAIAGIATAYQFGWLEPAIQFFKEIASK